MRRVMLMSFSRHLHACCTRKQMMTSERDEERTFYGSIIISPKQRCKSLMCSKQV